MALDLKTQLTLAEFEAFIAQPEQRDWTFEFIGGEIVEVPSNPFVSVIAARIITLIGMYLFQNTIQGHVTGEGGGFIIDGQVFAPDVAYVRSLPTNKGFEPTPPLLVVEVISEPDSAEEQTHLRRKMANYLAAGVVVWIVDYVARTVEVYAPNSAAQILTESQSLSGGAVLPGFTLPVKDIFPNAPPLTDSPAP